MGVKLHEGDTNPDLVFMCCWGLIVKMKPLVPDFLSHKDKKRYGEENLICTLRMKHNSFSSAVNSKAAEVSGGKETPERQRTFIHPPRKKPPSSFL